MRLYLPAIAIDHTTGFPFGEPKLLGNKAYQSPTTAQEFINSYAQIKGIPVKCFTLIIRELGD